MCCGGKEHREDRAVRRVVVACSDLAARVIDDAGPPVSRAQHHDLRLATVLVGPSPEAPMNLSYVTQVVGLRDIDLLEPCRVEDRLVAGMPVKVRANLFLDHNRRREGAGEPFAEFVELSDRVEVDEGCRVEAHRDATGRQGVHVSSSSASTAASVTGSSSTGLTPRL